MLTDIIQMIGVLLLAFIVVATAPMLIDLALHGPQRIREHRYREQMKAEHMARNRRPTQPKDTDRHE